MSNEDDPMNILTELQSDIWAVAKNLESREWIQGKMQEGDAVCAHGAVKTCNLRPGDEHIVRSVMRAQGLSEEWNDEDGRTKDEVLARFRSIEVSDDVLQSTFGPQWWEIVAVVRRAAVLSGDAILALGTAWDAAWGAALDAARDAARDADWDAARGTAWDAARGAAWDAARGAARDADWGAALDADWDAAWGAAWGAARDAAGALVVRDLIGHHGFTQQHFDILVGPWEKVTDMNLHGEM